MGSSAAERGRFRAFRGRSEACILSTASERSFRGMRLGARLGTLDSERSSREICIPGTQGATICNGWGQNISDIRGATTFAQMFRPVKRQQGEKSLLRQLHSLGEMEGRQQVLSSNQSIKLRLGTCFATSNLEKIKRKHRS